MLETTVLFSAKLKSSQEPLINPCNLTLFAAPFVKAKLCMENLTLSKAIGTVGVISYTEIPIPFLLGVNPV